MKKIIKYFNFIWYIVNFYVIISSYEKQDDLLFYISIIALIIIIPMDLYLCKRGR